MLAVAVMFLIVLILTPGLLLGFLQSPWFFLILFLLIGLLPVAWSRGEGTTRGSRPRRWAVWLLAVPVLLLALPVLLLGIFVTPFLFLIVLLMMLPLLWMAFGGSH